MKHFISVFLILASFSVTAAAADSAPDPEQVDQGILTGFYCATYRTHALVTPVIDHLQRYGLAACYTVARSVSYREYIYKQVDWLRTVDYDLGKTIGQMLVDAENAGLVEYFDDYCFEKQLPTEEQTKAVLNAQAKKWIAVSYSMGDAIQKFYKKTYHKRVDFTACTP